MGEDKVKVKRLASTLAPSLEKGSWMLWATSSWSSPSKKSSGLMPAISSPAYPVTLSTFSFHR